MAGDVALEAAFDLAVGLAFGSCGVRRRRGWLGRSGAGKHDDVQGPVELAVAAAVEAVTGGHLADEAGIGATPARFANAASLRHAPGVGPGAQHVGGDDRPDALLARAGRVASDLMIARMACSWLGGFGLHGLIRRPRSRNTVGVGRWSRRPMMQLIRRRVAVVTMTASTGPGTGPAGLRGRRRRGSGAGVAQPWTRRPRSGGRHAAPPARPLAARAGLPRWSRASASRPARTASRGSDFAPLRRAGRFGGRAR